MEDIYQKIDDLRKTGKKAVLCTVVASLGSTPGKTGFKMLVMENNQIFGTVGGGILEKTVIDKAGELIKSGESILCEYNLTKDLGMKCGGSMSVFLEPVFKRFTLLIFGAGHISKALSDLMRDINFDIYVIDERENIFENWDTNGLNIINKHYNDFLNDYHTDESTFITIITKGHDSDIEILKKCIKMPSAYLGMIGSKRKVEEVTKILLEGLFADKNELEKVEMPMGVDIGAVTHYEIAISIAARLIKIKNNNNKSK